MTTPTPSIGYDEFRRAMSHFASGVTVVTGMHDDEPVGFACQSFASVSLDPPLVLFCADHRGRSWPLIRGSGRFCVNVLTEEQNELCGRFGSSRGRRFEELDWGIGASGCPTLPEVLLRVHAEVETVHVAGDHDIVIGRVTALDEVRARATPMLFYRGMFGLEPEVDPLLSVPYVWGWGDQLR